MGGNEQRGSLVGDEKIRANFTASPTKSDNTINILFMGENAEPIYKILKNTHCVYTAIYSDRNKALFKTIVDKWSNRITDGVKVDYYSLFEVFKALHKMICNKKEIFIDITGCSKIALIAALLVTDLKKKDQKITFVYLAGNEIIELPKIEVNFGLKRITKYRFKIKLKILKLLINKPLSGVELARKLKKCKSDITYNMGELKENSLVKYVNKRYVLTPIGKEVYYILDYIMKYEVGV